jgi:hypothetical protein
MKQSALWLLPVVALASVGSLTYATSKSTIVEDGTKKHDSKVVSKLVPFAHDTEIDKYLTSVASYMLVPPRNGSFGASRVPTFHGTNIGSIPGYQDISELAKKSSIASFVVGTFPDDALKGYRDYQKANPNQKIEIPTYRITRVHSLYQNLGYATQQGKMPDRGAQTYDELRKLVQQVKKTIDEKGYDAYSESVSVNGAPGFIMAKAVHAVDKSCYSCHSNIKEGEPIGNVVAAIWKKAP